VAELHLVGSTDDGRQLLLARVPAGAAEFRLPIDEKLTSLLRTGRRPAPSASALTPRQIQAQLRAGASVEDVAARAGVPVGRLDAYAAPVLAELARVVEDALAARMSRPQQGPSALPLGPAVLTRLAGADGTGSRPAWSARRDHDATWVVEMRCDGDSVPTVARWRWDRASRSLAPLDGVAAELGHVAAGGTQSEDETRPAAPVAVAAAETPVAAPAPGVATAEAADAGPSGVRTKLAPEAAPRSVRASRSSRRPAVPAWSDVLLGVAAAPARAATGAPEDTEAAG